MAKAKKLQLIADAWRVLKKGESVADPTTWKNRLVATNALAALLVSVIGLAQSAGYELNVLPEQAEQVAGYITGLIWVGMNIYGTYATSTKVGIGSADES